MVGMTVRYSSRKVFVKRRTFHNHVSSVHCDKQDYVSFRNFDSVLGHKRLIWHHLKVLNRKGPFAINDTKASANFQSNTNI